MATLRVERKDEREVRLGVGGGGFSISSWGSTSTLDLIRSIFY